MKGRELKKHLNEGNLLLTLGPFSVRLKSASSMVLGHLSDIYRDYRFSPCAYELHDYYLAVRAPNFLRGLIKRQIIPDPGFYFPAVPLPEKMGALAFEMGLNIPVALRTYNQLILHAGVVGNQHGGVIISAASGSGKSTLTALLMEEGFRLFSDEFGIVDTEQLQLIPYPRPISLKNASIDVVRDIAGSDWISPVIEGSPKGSIAYRRARKSDLEGDQVRVPPKLILFPTFEKGSEPSMKKMETADTVMRLLESSTNYQIMGEAAFHAVNRIAKNAVAFEIQYGSSEAALKLFKAAREEAGL